MYFKVSSLDLVGFNQVNLFSLTFIDCSTWYVIIHVSHLVP